MNKVRNKMKLLKNYKKNKSANREQINRIIKQIHQGLIKNH